MEDENGFKPKGAIAFTLLYGGLLLLLWSLMYMLMLSRGLING